jgi:hypothetical protein
VRAARRFALALFSLVAASACSHVTAAAPYGRSVRLLAGDEATTVERRYRAWFAIWGLVRVSGKDPADVIRDEELCAARVRVEDNIPDAFIGVLYTIVQPIGIIPQSIVINGRRAGPDGRCE